MCELFGYSSSTTGRLAEPLRWFRARGGATADNCDGWGVAWNDTDSLRVHKEPAAAADSEIYDRLAGQLTSDLVIAHVRKANPPTARVAANTHPFRRNCCGRVWVFAHNGMLPNPAALCDMGATPPCAPLGDTDSEHAFCLVLDRIAANFHPAAHHWLDDLARTAETLASRGRFNFLMSNGTHLIAYGHDRLHDLDDAGTVVIATEPLTASPDWRAFEPGELRVYRAGQRTARILTHPATPPTGQEPGAVNIKEIVS